MPQPPIRFGKEFQRRAKYAVPNTQYLVADPQVRGGAVTVEFTRIDTLCVAQWREYMSIDEIISEYFIPGTDPTKIVEAIAYHHDHFGTMEAIVYNGK